MIISIFTIKGGTGKTTTTINLAGALSANGYSVLVVDNDPQSNITQICDVDDELNMYDLYTNKNVGAVDCIKKFKKNFYVIPNTIESEIFKKSTKLNKENFLKIKLGKIKDEFDFILIDNSPALSLFSENSLIASDMYITVIDNSVSSVKALKMVENAVYEVKESLLNEKIKPLGILRSRFDKITVFTKQVSQVVEKKYEKLVFKSIIPDSVRYKEAVAKNLDIFDYVKEYNYDSKYSDVYINLMNEILERIGEQDG